MNDEISTQDGEKNKTSNSSDSTEDNNYLKQTLIADVSTICEVTTECAKSVLEAVEWDAQRAIDILLDQNESDKSSSDDDVAVLKEVPKSKSDNEFSEPHSKVPRQNQESKNENPSPGSSSSMSVRKTSELRNFSKLAPEQFSIMSWNLDGLDDKNLERRTQYVVELIEKEKHDIIFLQELVPWTFDYIARRLHSDYHPIPGTKNPMCEYLTGTFLRRQRVYFEECEIKEYENSLMGRTILITKAFIGKVKLFLINTHLESTAKHKKKRVEQLKMCFELMKKAGPEYNVIFGGDLNLRDDEVCNSIPSDIVDLWIECGSRQTCKYTWDLTRNTNKQMPCKYQPRCRFDRIYFKSSSIRMLSPEFFGITGIEKVPKTQSFASDHWAIMAFFKLTNDARQPDPVMS